MHAPAKQVPTEHGVPSGSTLVPQAPLAESHVLGPKHSPGFPGQAKGDPLHAPETQVSATVQASLSSQGPPDAGVQKPSCVPPLATEHAMQPPEQALSQHTPSTQADDAQSSAVVHDVPFGPLVMRISAELRLPLESVPPATKTRPSSKRVCVCALRAFASIGPDVHAPVAKVKISEVP